MLLILYRSLARSTFDYGFHSLSIDNKKKFNLKLTKIHNRILRMILGYRISTPIVVMPAELREVPLRDRFQLISDKFFIKTLHKILRPIFSTLEELDYISQNNKSQCPSNKHFFILKSFSKFRGYTNRVLRMSIPRFLLIPDESQFFQPSIDLQLGPTIYNSRSLDLVFNKLVLLEYPNQHIFTQMSLNPLTPFWVFLCTLLN